MTDTNQLIYKLNSNDSDDAIVFVSGLGLDIKQQREAFVRRFARRYGVSYMALDCNQRISDGIPFASFEQEAMQAVKTHFSKKNLFLTGACFGANVAMRLANRFSDQTKALVIVSPAINYSEPSITHGILKNIERKKCVCQKMNLKKQLQQILIFEQLVKKMLPYADIQQQDYQGLIKILHPQNDNFIPLSNSENMLQTLNRENVSLQVLSNETHTLRKDNRLLLPILVLQDVLQKHREN